MTAFERFLLRITAPRLHAPIEPGLRKNLYDRMESLSMRSHLFYSSRKALWQFFSKKVWSETPPGWNWTCCFFCESHHGLISKYAFQTSLQTIFPTFRVEKKYLVQEKVRRISFLLISARKAVYGVFGIRKITSSHVVFRYLSHIWWARLIAHRSKDQRINWLTFRCN